MAPRSAKTILGAALGAALCLTLAASPASAEERPDHWDNGYIPYANGRYAETDATLGAYASVAVEWEGYKVSLSGTVWDRAADTYGVRMEVGYNWQNGAAWEWTTRILGKAEGGKGDSKSSSAHSKAGVNVKGVKIRACTVNNSNVVVACSPWA
ncbi:hypothetical protein [Streptomyces formicae]|uniref:Secreted protein n=1 Tax=Streptomyces formicae TaxID=1616117 RepID=A0A291Q3E6_9ACTN|nr:hypothetical protein [Streptomyces formicae]ATL26017.1 hypothetical protein KY5_0999c [Streptomyces formicae]